MQPLDFSTSAQPVAGSSSYEREKFLADVNRIKDYIVAGDAFQVLLARRIDVPYDFSSASLYRALRVINPSPYMYHLVLDGIEIVGSSPELLVRVERKRVTVRPIAGTPAPTGFQCYLRLSITGNCATNFALFNGARMNPRCVPSGPITARLPLWSTV